MISTRTLLLLLAFAGVSPASASADWFLTPFYGVTFGTDTSLVDLEAATGLTKQVFGGSISLMGSGILGVEAEVGYVPGFFQRDNSDPLVTDSSLTTVAGNVVVATPLSWTRESLRPYFVGGVGLMRAYVNDVFNVVQIDKLVAVDVGGGLIGFFNDRTGVRFELRYFSSIGEPEGAASFGTPRLSQWRASIGLVLRRPLF
jgi:hypothetical protein